MGEYDDVALEALLRAGAKYVALVASSERCAAVLATLRARGLGEPALSSIRNPAGLNINAKTPAEVAVSIIADIIHVMGEMSAREPGPRATSQSIQSAA